MSLPVWDSDTILKYKGRWNALQRVGRRIENESTTDDDSRLLLANNVFPNSDDLTPPFEAFDWKDRDGELLASFIRLGDTYLQLDIAEGSPADGQSLNYDSLYEGLSHLLYTQPDNPPPRRLIRHLDGEENRRACYQEISIPKKRGGERTLTVPHHPLKWLQRSLLTVLTHLFPRHKCAHGFERGKSIVTHAGQHTNKKYVYTIDIKDFFPSITRNRIFGMLQAYPINASTPVARYLANLTCYDGCLPQGAPTSPILSNLLCRRLDSRLFKWARQNGYTYSRYADDLTFSTNNDSFPESDISFIDDIIRDEGFEVNDEKRRLQPYYERQMVTGLVVNEKVNLPREKLRGLRALLHNIDEHGWLSQVNRGCVFEDADEWCEYINADLSRAKYRNIERKQRQNDQLLNPAATLPHVEDEDDLREVVRGKVEFVGAVRGKDDDMYQRMLAKFEKLSERLTRYQKGVEAGMRAAQEEASEDSASDRQEKENYSESEHPEQMGDHYSQIKEWISELKKEENGISLSEFRDRLANWKDHSLEVVWNLKNTRGDSQEEVIRRFKKIAYILDLNPHETRKFFEKFRDQYSFKSLVHPPKDDSFSPESMIGKCIEHFNEMKYNNEIPNRLKKETEAILSDVKSYIESKGNHPWVFGKSNSGIKEKLVRYKKNTRLDNGDIEERLNEYAEKLETKHDVEIFFPEFGGVFFHTHVPSILPPLKEIISSMAKHTKSKFVKIESERSGSEGFPEALISISDEDSVFDEKSDIELSRLISGSTGDALYDLPSDTGIRGFARWTLTAPFSDGNVYLFDITKNERYSVESHDGGVEHRIYFPLTE